MTYCLILSDPSTCLSLTMYVLGHKLKWSQNCGWFGCSFKHLHLGLIPIVQLINFPNSLQLQIFKGTDERQGCWNHISECQHLQASTLEPAPHLPMEVLASPAITWVYLDAAGGAAIIHFKCKLFAFHTYYIADTSWQEADNIHSSIDEDHFCWWGVWWSWWVHYCGVWWSCNSDIPPNTPNTRMPHWNVGDI